MRNYGKFKITVFGNCLVIGKYYSERGVILAVKNIIKKMEHYPNE